MTATSVATTPAPAPAFTPDQVALIKNTICKGATNDELQLFLYQAQRTGLDPLARQIYSVLRREFRDGQWVTVRSIQTSIDGLRLTAERSGKYAGQIGPQWCGTDAIWRDVWMETQPPAAARVGILRTDFKEPLWGVARFASYAQKTRGGGLTRAWATMSDVMIAKCAEALGLRRAFPQELSGLYTAEEMSHIEPEATPPAPNKQTAADVGPYDAETGELPADDEPSPADTHSAATADEFIDKMKSFTSANDLRTWSQENATAFGRLDQGDQARVNSEYKLLMKNFAA